MKDFVVYENCDRVRASKQLKAALVELRGGGAISDANLKILLDFFRNAEGVLDALGPHYHLAWSAVYNDLVMLEQFEMLRKRP